jgi:hypothetical protein
MIGGRTNVHDVELNGWSRVVGDKMFKALTNIFFYKMSSQFLTFRVNFHKIHALFPREYQRWARLPQVLCKIGSENDHGCSQNTENGFGLDFLRAIHPDIDETLNDILRGTGDENSVSFANVETKKQSRQLVHTYTPNNRKKFTQTSDRKQILHVIARPHTCTKARTRALLEHLKWKLFCQLPYSPDLAMTE